MNQRRRGMERLSTWASARSVTSGVGHIIFLISFVFLFNEVLGQTSSLASGAACVCEGVSCEKNLTAAECPNGRVIPRKDCNCCFVCAKQLTEKCNSNELSCDSDFGLTCGEDDRCQASIPCTDDTTCSNDRFCVGGACADPCRVLPDVCRGEKLINGVCVVRNHRAMCSCSEGMVLDSEAKECFPATKSSHCSRDGRKIDVGSSYYSEKCSKKCNCEDDGEMSCKNVEKEPDCPKGFVPMSKITGDMSEVCKILIGNDQLFDGCCVPQKCLNATTQEDSKGSRGFRLTESQNNLGDEDDKPKPREMLLGEDEHPVGHSDSNSEEMTTVMPAAKDTRSSSEVSEEDDLSVSVKSLKDTVSSTTTTSSPTSESSLLAGGSSSPMQVIVLKRTDHSAVIELPKNDNEAQLSIALSAQLQKTPENPDVWKIHKIPTGLPDITLSDLQPNTSYTLKYSHSNQDLPPVQFMTEDKPDEDESHTMIPDLYNDVTDGTDSAVLEDEAVTGMTTVRDAGTGTMILMTDEEKSPSNETSPSNGNGTTATTTTDTLKIDLNSTSHCVFNGTTYDSGHVILDGCDQRCECMKDGQMKCVERCSIPFFKKGHFAHDPLCYEEPSGVDECCIIAACARSNNNNGAGEARVLKLSPCDTVKCGPNSECRYEVSPSGMQSDQENQETLCVCKEGFSGDAYDETIGCISGPSSTTSAPSPASSKQLSSSPAEKVEGCIFNNKTYEFGAEHFDGCSYKCHCESSGEFLCRPRCTFQRDEEKEIPAGCEVKKDPSDSDGCCEMIVCHGEPLESGSRKENPDIPVDGCVFKNETYEKDAKFYDGCEQQCMCFSNGDVTCQPRCPPAGPNTHDDCITLPDPTDKCCTVTICDPQEKLAMSDVMKAANETLFNSTSTTTTPSPTTIVPILVPIGRSDDIPTTVQPLTSSSTTTTPKSETADLTETPIFLEESKETLGSPSPSTPLSNTKPVLAKLSMVIPVNETSVMVTISIQEKDLATLDDQMVKIYYSTDMKAWMELEARIKDLYVEGTDDIHTVINGLLPGKEYFFKAKVNETETNILSGYTRTNTGSSEEFEMGSHEVISGEEGDNSGHGSSSSMEDAMCKYKDRFFSYGQEFYDGCDAYCSCEDNGMLKCVPIECPTDLGLELLDANCLRWEPITKNFRKDPPHCCPEMRCVQNSTCSLAGGFQFNNYDEIPQKITGCDKRCYCENGNITCENLCPPMSEKPPADLPCPPEMAMPVTMPPNECCFSWVCRNHPHPNVTDGSPSVDKHLLNRTLTHDTTNMTHLTHNGTLIPYHPDDDQFVPPSTGNQPSFVPLNKINRDQLQDLLHQLSTITADGGGQQHSEEIRPVVPQGTYLSVKDPEQVQELERTAGAKVIEQAEDGSFILFIPSHPVPHRQNPIPIYAHPHPEVLHGHAGQAGFPFGHPFQYEAHPHGPSPTDQLGNVMIRALNESTLQIDFTVSPVLVGLHGVVEVLYTKDFVAKTNPDQWERQVFQQAEDLIDNSHLQLFLTGLAPDTEYHLKIQVIMKDIQNAPSSELLMIRTPPLAVPTTTLPPEIVVDAEVNLVDATSNTVKVTWRKFTDFEGSLIDGVQIKYRAEQDQVYSTTPLIHRSITNYELTNLQPGQSYEVDLLFIPFTNQTTELRSEKPIHIKTLPEEDVYAFTIAVDAGKVTESSAELIWDGVPYPEDKYVNIYQVIYQSDLQKEQKSTFKVAKRDNNKKAVITDLKPGTRYRVWVEAFLTNGKKKRTNVIDVLTKAGQLPTPDRASQDKLLEDARSKESVAEPGSYYGALVALAIVAALSIIGIVVLLMILIRKQNHAKAPINDRKSESSYDNPSFKNYDLESNGHSKPGDP